MVELYTALKKYKYQEFVRLTIKELLGFDQNMIYRELSHLALAIVKRVGKELQQQLLKEQNLTNKDIGEFTIFTMGKLGGLELNYSSDIDLIGIHAQDKPLKDSNTHEFYAKFFIKLGQILSQTDQHGFLFRVDWDLRPEGKSGTMTNSLVSCETYYTTFGAEWERQAFIKAAPLYPEQHLDQQLVKMLTPFVYRKTFDEKTIQNIWNMKANIVKAWQQKQSSALNIKLDAGGIRDIEFFAQGFQLLYGGKTPALRSRNTVATLQELAKQKLISPTESQILIDSYLFLRRLESCIQMQDEQQSHTVKNDTQHKLELARRLGLSGENDQVVEKLEQKIKDVGTQVKSLFEKVYQHD